MRGITRTDSPHKRGHYGGKVKRAEADPEQFKKIYVGIPWDFEMPPRLPKNWRELGLESRWPLPKDDKPSES